MKDGDEDLVVRLLNGQASVLGSFDVNALNVEEEFALSFGRFWNRAQDNVDVDALR